jgi:hypothetical protein
MNLRRVGERQLQQAYEATFLLISILNLDHVDPTYLKLDALRHDIMEEQDKRKELAKQR